MTATNDPRAAEFEAASRRYRRELLAYCYRMSGSPDEAEDLVQETFANAWRSYRRFEGRSSLRTWLYRIATNSCLKALEQARRRLLPSAVVDSTGDPFAPIAPEPTAFGWLHPIPDALFLTEPANPATVVEERQNMRLALVAALQTLPPRQRAVFILREVLQWRAGEVADLLEITSAAVDSTMQRARARLKQAAPTRDTVTEPTEAAQRRLLDRYATAFVTADIAGLTRLLTEDARWEMPPTPTWFTGRDTIGRFLSARLPTTRTRLVPVAANGQPGFAVYHPAEDGRFHAHALEVLTLAHNGIAGVVHFLGTAHVDGFSLPRVWE